MHSMKVLLTLTILGTLLAGGGYYFFHKTQVHVEAPQVQQPPVAQTPPAVDYGTYETAKHPTFPGVGKADSGSTSK